MVTGEYEGRHAMLMEHLMSSGLVVGQKFGEIHVFRSPSRDGEGDLKGCPNACQSREIYTLCQGTVPRIHRSSVSFVRCQSRTGEADSPPHGAYPPGVGITWRSFASGCLAGIKGLWATSPIFGPIKPAGAGF